MTNEEFAKALRQAKKAKDVTLEAIAKAVGVDKSTVSRWADGITQPRGRHLHKLAAFLDAPYLAVGLEGQSRIEGEALDLLLQIAERAMIGAGLPNAAEAVLEGMELSEPQRRLLARAAPGIRREISQAAGEEWEALSEAERRQVLAAVAARHLVPEGEDRSS